MDNCNSTKNIKKFPILHQKASFNEIYIKGSRPLKVYERHSRKVLNKYDVLIIHAITATISKAVSLCNKIRDQYPYLSCQVFTNSIPTLIQIDGSKQVKEKSAIHIVLKKISNKL